MPFAVKGEFHDATVDQMELFVGSDAGQNTPFFRTMIENGGAKLQTELIEQIEPGGGLDFGFWIYDFRLEMKGWLKLTYFTNRSSNFFGGLSISFFAGWGRFKHE
ncbi:MAG: hypothetical protein PHV34_21855 [Verrucomicrobiae bacterium]|nr:hypothetical protein [Verrucomicrobiae bacterium]